MTTTPTNTVLRHIHGLLAADPAGQAADGELLSRFATRHEETAFATLVQRHGPLVLGVCRRVLHDWHDAEDAFQATFLTLARNAASAGRVGSLAGWLHRVAYHAAVRTRARAARRRRCERKANLPAAPDPLAEVSGREFLAVLDEELQRLPERYRAPLVLCYLEGRPREEAARHMGYSLGTLKRRLEEGRSRLGAQLARRGLALSAGLMVLGVTHGGARAAVSAGLTADTVKAGLAAAAGLSLLPALGEAVRRAVGGSKLRGAAALLLALGALGLGAGALTRPAQAQRPAESEGVAEAPAAAPDRPAASAAPAQREDGEKMTVSGRVLDPEGKPLARAEVVVLAGQYLYLSSWEPWTISRNEVLGRARTDAEGRYRLAVRRTDPMLTVRETRVVAGAPGHGLSWQWFGPSAGQAEEDVHLTAEQPIRGRLVGLQGEPAAGVTLHVVQVTRAPVKGEPGSDHSGDLPGELLTATTDARGDFILRGFGPGMKVELAIRDPRYQRKSGWVIDTADRKACENVRLAVPPGQVVEGRVVYDDTGEPVPHAKMSIANPVFEAEADGQGRFRISLFPAQEIGIRAFPPAGTPYLVGFKGVVYPKGVVKQEAEVRLPRGVLVQGKITEAGTGKPVAGACVRYNGDWGKGTVISGPDGSYGIGVPVGVGRLTVTHPSGDYLQQVIGSAGGSGARAVGDPAYCHAVVELDVKRGEKVKEVPIALRRGVTLKGRVMGPDGKPIVAAVMFVSGHRPRFEKTMGPDYARNGRFEIHGCDPEKTYRVVLLERWWVGGAMDTEGLGSFGELTLPELLGTDIKLGAAVELSAKTAGEGPVVVRLAPCGSARLRFLDADGKPLANYTPWVQLAVTPGPPFYKALEKKTLAAEIITLLGHYGGGRPGERATDAQGRITLEGLIPGATYRLKKTGQYPRNDVLEDFTVEAGKTLEMDVVVK
jgi:RNA polymerase sigma factor (sigma-70 family)